MDFKTDKAIEFLKNFDSTIRNLRAKADMLKNSEKNGVAIARVKELFMKTLPHVQTQAMTIQLYGSRIIGIGTRNSDLDIFVKVEGLDAQKFFSLLGNAFKVSKAWKWINVVERTSVPVIKGTTLIQKLNCE